MASALHPAAPPPLWVSDLGSSHGTVPATASLSSSSTRCCPEWRILCVGAQSHGRLVQATGKRLSGPGAVRDSSEAAGHDSAPDFPSAPHDAGITSRRTMTLQLGTLLALGLGLPVPYAIAEQESGCTDLTIAPNGLAFCDTSTGNGMAASAGSLIKAHYTGRLEDGTVFDSSYKRGRPLVFRVGVGEVIRGWDQGIIGAEGIPPMLAGGKRTLRIPPELGYGDRGAGCRAGSCIIPPRAVLIFDVEFVGKV